MTDFMKTYKKNLDKKSNAKEKNNFDVFEEMTQQEWESVVEPELVEFLREIVT